MMKHSLIIILLSVAVFGCETKHEKPEEIWSKERFVEVLTQMQLAESVIRLGYHRTPDSLYSNDSIYSAALRSVNTNQEEYEQNMDYYLDHPKELEEIYDEVMVNLSTKSAELKGKKASEKDSSD